MFQTQAQGSPHKFQAVNAIAIAEQIAGWLGVGKRLGQLLRGPSRRRRIGDVEMEDFAALMGQDEENLEDVEGGGRDDQEIHRDQVLGMVVEEGFQVWSRSRVRGRYLRMVESDTSIPSLASSA